MSVIRSDAKPGIESPATDAPAPVAATEPAAKPNFVASAREFQGEAFRQVGAGERTLTFGEQGPPVAALAGALRVLGYQTEEPGAPTDQVTRTLQNALASFQRDARLDPSGDLDRPTLEALDRRLAPPKPDLSQPAAIGNPADGASRPGLPLSLAFLDVIGDTVKETFHKVADFAEHRFPKELAEDLKDVKNRCLSDLKAVSTRGIDEAVGRRLSDPRVKEELRASIEMGHYGSKLHKEYGAVVEFLSGGKITAVQAMQMNPTGGLCGPGAHALSITFGPLHAHSVRHDAIGFLGKYMGIGPGYGGFNPNDCTSGQITGTIREMLKPTPLPDVSNVPDPPQAW